MSEDEKFYVGLKKKGTMAKLEEKSFWKGGWRPRKQEALRGSEEECS